MMADEMDYSSLCLCPLLFRNVFLKVNRPRKYCRLHNNLTVCFTACLFISPDLDGNRAPSPTGHQLTVSDVHDMFVKLLVCDKFTLDTFRGPELN